MTETLDTPLVRVPFESLKRTTRDRKYAIDEVASVVNGIRSISDSASTSTTDAINQQLGTYVTQLQTLKRKLQELGASEQADAQRCKARLSHLAHLGSAERDNHIKWSRQRIDRILIDHMLRSGYYDAAVQLVKETGLQDVTDVYIFEAARAVTEGLQQHDCSQALAWCETNRTRLKKAKSQLEFRLRMQEFVELLRAGKSLDAITYGRQHLAPLGSQYLPELQRAAAALAFRPDTTCQRYAALFSDDRWQELVDMFRSELYKLHSQPPVSALVVHLEAGLSALKSPSSYETGCSREDPLHLPTYRKLAEDLPSSKHVHSKLICAITHTVMNEHNPPMVLPNGYVYSEQALAEMSAKNEGKIKCPHTGVVYSFSQLRRAFIS